MAFYYKGKYYEFTGIGLNTSILREEMISHKDIYAVLKHPFSAVEVARVFRDIVVKLHGLLKTIVTDRDPMSCGKFWRELFHVLYSVLLHGISVNTRIHPVFHVSLLKRAPKNGISVTTHLPTVDEEGQFIVEPMAILGRKLVKKGNLPVTQILVQWKHSQHEDATWEDFLAIQSQFPHFCAAGTQSGNILVDKD